MHLYKKLLSMLLAFALLLSLSLGLLSCKPTDGEQTENQGQTGSQPPSDEGGKEDEKVIQVPAFKDYPDKNTVKYADMVYSRPNFDAAIADFEDTIHAIEQNTISYDSQLAKIEALYEPYSKIETAYALIQLKQSLNSLDKEVNEEHAFVSTRYPDFADAIEQLYVACARSEHARRFEEDYFRADISKYADGGKLSDEVVALLREEAAMETTYNTLSANAEIEYRGKTGTYESFLAQINQKYATMLDSSQHLAELTALKLAYENQIVKPINELYVNLVVVRRKIADAMNYESYLPYAYEVNGYEYTTEEMRSFLAAIKQYVAPVYWDEDFYKTYSLIRQTTENARVDRVDLINNLYAIYTLSDEEISDAYRFMLQYELYNVEKNKTGRFEGAFTTYFSSYDAPFVFASIYGRSSDYLTLAHEFGHFTDMFYNASSTESLDLSETYSQGLELLTVLASKRVLPSEATVYLKYSALYSALESMMIQGFYSEFELRVYELEMDEITEESISQIARDVAKEFGFYKPENFDISNCTITHTVLYPTYVQSYCTSSIAALELYMLESEQDTKGFEVYKKLLHTESKSSFISALAEAGLSSPFAAETVKHLTDEVYFEFLGKHYYCDGSDCNAA